VALDRLQCNPGVFEAINNSLGMNENTRKRELQCWLATDLAGGATTMADSIFIVGAQRPMPLGSAP